MDWSDALGQLRSHKLQALFIHSLGWQAIEPNTIQAFRHLKQTCKPMAQCANVIAWQVKLTAKTQFTPTLRQQIYSAIAEYIQSVAQNNDPHLASSPNPLVIFINNKQTQSLWCQSETESAVYISDQPTLLWQYRLQRFAKDYFTQVGKGLFPSLSQAQDQTMALLIRQLSENTTGISLLRERREYAALTMQRLIFIQQLQQRGFMNGDTWYLQTYFAKATQQEENLFYKTYLRSLYQNLSLPALERPNAFHQVIGDVPFLGPLFDTHWIEAKYESIDIADSGFEDLLGWLSEQSTMGSFNPWMSADLTCWLSRYWQSGESNNDELSCTPELARMTCNHTLDALLIDRLCAFTQRQNQTDQTLNDLLFAVDSRTCRTLIQEILPNLRLLNPACGRDAILSTFYRRLVEIFSVLTGYIQQTKDAQLKIWQSALTGPAAAIDRESPSSASLVQNIQKRILRNNIYGVAASAAEMESVHFQLLHHLVASAQHREQLEPLIDIGFNVMHGSALIGLINVDEERFDQVNQAGAGSVLQGNLLQPLAADSYQTILSERNIALEHYQARTQVLATSNNIPLYARSALLRSQISELDTKAQKKLDTLLLNQMSQQLGMRYRESSLSEKPRYRLLNLEDVETLAPFHWGYRFSSIVRRGGFDIVACQPLSGTFKPEVAEFVQQFPDLSEEKGVSPKTFKTSKLALAKQDKAVAQHWLQYQDQYACVSDYFYRSDLYQHQTPTNKGRISRTQLAWERLFIEQCFNLLSAAGIGAVVVPAESIKNERIQPLMAFLEKATEQVELVQSDGDFATNNLDLTKHVVLVIKGKHH